HPATGQEGLRPGAGPSQVTAPQVLSVVVIGGGARSPDDALAALPLPDGYEVADRITVDARRSGFAVALTRGIDQSRGRYVLVLPPDVAVERGGAPAMAELLDGHPEVAAVSPQTRDAAGSLVTPAPLAALGRVDEDDPGTAPFGCLLVRRSSFV